MAPSSVPRGMAIDVDHQNRLVADGARREVGGVVSTRWRMMAVRVSLRIHEPQFPAMKGRTWSLRFTGLGMGLPAFSSGSFLPQSTCETRAGSTWRRHGPLPVGLGELAVRFGEEGPASFPRSWLLVPVCLKPVGLDLLLLLPHLPPKKKDGSLSVPWRRARGAVFFLVCVVPRPPPLVI